MTSAARSRLTFVTGKGGVGKSTVVAALAVEAARQGRRPLVVELGHRASMRAIFGCGPIGHVPQEVAEGVHATNIEMDPALREYVRAHVPVSALARRITKSTSLARFFEAAPAVGEILTLWRLEQLLGQGWDPVLVDLDATGHALMFLELPRVFDGLVDEGPVRRLLDGFAGLLRRGGGARLSFVTLPLELPVRETLELHKRIAEEHEVELGTLFVNRMPRLAEATQSELDAATATLGPAHDAAADLALLGRRLDRRARADQLLERLRATGLETVCLPTLDLVDADGLSQLGRLAGGQR